MTAEVVLYNVTFTPCSMVIGASNRISDRMLTSALEAIASRNSLYDVAVAGNVLGVGSIETDGCRDGRWDVVGEGVNDGFDVGPPQPSAGVQQRPP